MYRSACVYVCAYTHILTLRLSLSLSHTHTLTNTAIADLTTKRRFVVKSAIAAKEINVMLLFLLSVHVLSCQGATTANKSNTVKFQLHVFMMHNVSDKFFFCSKGIP